MLQGGTDVVQALGQPMRGVLVDGELVAGAPRGDGARLQVNHHLVSGVGLRIGPQLLHHGLLHLGHQQPGLAGVGAEDVAEARTHHHLEAVVLQRPHGVLARGTGTKVGAHQQNRTRGIGLLVQHKFRIIAPRREQPVLETGAGDALQVNRRNDLVGIHIGAPQRNRNPRVG